MIMTRVSIYNEKGGVGKTTVSYLLAGYLAYEKGLKVCVLDFDSPTFHFCSIRDLELRFLENPKSALSVWLRDNHPAADPYDVIRMSTDKAGCYDIDSIFKTVMDVCSRDYDYVIMDFPGRFSDNEPISYLAANGFIDFVAVPMDTDSQARKSALVVAEALHRSGVACAAFWNKVTIYESKGDGSRFRRGAEPFARYGIPVMESMVREIRKFSRDANENLFIRSTLCFPKRYILQWCPSVIPFLESLIQMIDSSVKQQEP